MNLDKIAGRPKDYKQHDTLLKKLNTHTHILGTDAYETLEKQERNKAFGLLKILSAGEMGMGWG